MDIINEPIRTAQLVELSNNTPINVQFPITGDPLPVEVSNDTPLEVNIDEDYNKTPSTGKVNVFLDSVVCRWIDANNVVYHEIYPLTAKVFDVENINDGINLNSFMGAYKGMIESIVVSGTTYSVTLNYHQYNSSNHMSWLNYGQTYTKP